VLPVQTKEGRRARLKDTRTYFIVLHFLVLLYFPLAASAGLIALAQEARKIMIQIKKIILFFIDRVFN